MSRPLKIRYAGAAFDGLQEMTDAEIDYTAHQICVAAASQISGSGPLTLNYNGASGTSIGSFIDTWRPDLVGSHPVGTTINSSSNTFKQNLATVTESPTRPVEFSTGAMREMASTEIDTYIFPRVVARLAALDVGSYVLQPSAPAGGTWVSVATVTDTAQSGNSTTYLWRKTADSAPTAIRPLKVYGSSGVHEMSDSDIRNMFGNFANRVISTGIGQYRVQETAPVGGTWVRMGSSFSDTRQQTGNVTYTGGYTGAYAGGYVSTYAGAYAGTYSSQVAKTYSGAYAGTYVLYYAGIVGGYYTGYYTGFYTGYYTRGYTGYYTGYYANTFTGYYSGTYTGYYTGLTVLSSKETPSTISLWLRTA